MLGGRFTAIHTLYCCYTNYVRVITASQDSFSKWLGLPLSLRISGSVNILRLEMAAGGGVVVLWLIQVSVHQNQSH